MLCNDGGVDREKERRRKRERGGKFYNAVFYNVDSESSTKSVVVIQVFAGTEMRSQTTKHLAVPGPDFAHLLQSFFQTSN